MARDSGAVIVARSRSYLRCSTATLAASSPERIWAFRSRSPVIALPVTIESGIVLSSKRSSASASFASASRTAMSSGRGST